MWNWSHFYPHPQIQKGKLHGSIDVGLSVMSIKKRARRIDLDTEEHIYHLKVTGEGPFFKLANRPRKETRPTLVSPSSGKVSRHLWRLGVQAASPSALSAERDCAISPRRHHENVPALGCYGVPSICPDRRKRGKGGYLAQKMRQMFNFFNLFLTIFICWLKAMN